MMKKRILSCLLALLFLSGLFAVPETALAAHAVGTGRALMIGCGEYIVSSANLSPSPENDAKTMAAVFKNDPRFSAVYTYFNLNPTSNDPIIGDKLMGEDPFSLEELIARAYAGATSADVSVFYYSGHGALYNNDACLHMSDLQLYSAKKLRAALDKVPGTKVIILDSCFSGGAISKSAKGAENFDSAFISAFSRTAKGSLNHNDYYVFTSSTENENSWGDGADENAFPMGEFTRALTAALGDDDTGGQRVAADDDLNGTVTLREAYDYVRQNSILSKAQVYPENSDFPLFRYKYSANNCPYLVKAAVSTVNGGAPYQLSFRVVQSMSATVSIRRLRIKRVSSSTINVDMSTVATLHSGTLGAGQRTFLWDGAETAFGEENDDYFFCIQESVSGWQRLIPFTANQKVAPVLTVTAPSRFDIVGETEICVEIGFNTRCAIDAQIIDGAGTLIATLAKKDTAVPELRTEADDPINVNKYYWDGKDNQGNYVPNGLYTLRTRASNAVSTLPWASQALAVAGGISLRDLKPFASAFDPEREQLNMTFTASTGIVSYSVAKDGQALYTSDEFAAESGTNSVTWNGRDNKGALLEEGLYDFILQLRDGARRVSQSITIELQRSGASSITAELPDEWALTRNGLVLDWHSTARGDAEISFINKSGVTMYTEKSKVTPGKQTFRWSGIRNNGKYLADGKYTVKILLRKSNGETAEFTDEMRVYMFPKVQNIKLLKNSQPANKAIQVRLTVDGKARAIVRIKDSANNILLTRNAFVTQSGLNQINWTLKDKSGKYLSPGKYTVSVTFEYEGYASKEQTLPITLT